MNSLQSFSERAFGKNPPFFCGNTLYNVGNANTRND